MAEITPVVARLSVSSRDLPVGIGRRSRVAKNDLSRAPATSARPPPSIGQSSCRAQSATKEAKAVWKPAACSRLTRSALSEGSSAPSRTSRPTREGNSPAYVAPRKVPYEAPT